MNHHALQQQINTLADDIGRLRRHADPDSYAEHLAQRFGNHVQAIDAIINASAAEIAAYHAPGDEDALNEAIRLVDEHASKLRTRLGLKP